MDKELREKIAIKIHTSERMLVRIVYETSPLNCSWEELPKGFRELYLQEALSYIALIKEAGYVKLAGDQSLPSFRNAVNKSYNDYMLGQEDMLKAGWQKAEVQDE